jgi:hypothetical protein
MNVIKETPGVILIDELDVHLHPRWQRLIVHSLKTVFPAVQFIAEAVEALLRQVFAALEDKDLSIARTRIAELRVMAPGLPELSGAEALLKRKEAIGR